MGRLFFGLVLMVGTLAGLAAGAVITALPASAAQAVTCTAPASGGSSTTFHAGVTSSYPVACQEETGISGTSAYPTIAVNTSNLPADSNPTLATGAGCTQSHSGSGTSEEWIETCGYSASPSAADESGTAYTANFTATPGAFSGSTLSPITSGTLSVTVNAPTVTCIDPAAAGSATTFFENSTNSYTVECEEQSGISSVSAYPSSIAIATGSVPADGNPAFATSTSSSPACTTGTSGSGATEEYILECALSDSPTSSDGGSYPLTFTAKGAGGVGSVTSGTLTVTIAPQTTTCSTPASGGTSVSWVDGTAETETLICYSQGYASANASNYPSSIKVNSGSIPSDASEATSLSSTPACTTATSGSGTSTEYELECKITDTPVAADNGTYNATFLATGGTGAGTAISGTLTITISQPAPSWATSGSNDGTYFSAIKGVPFCDDIEVSAGQVGPSGTNPGSTASLPLTSLTAGATPAGVTNYSIQDVNLTTGSAQLCGTNNNNVASAPVTMAPVATNSGGSATDSIPLWSQNECTWSSTGASVSMFDANQDLEQAGSQSSFGQPIANGVTGGTTVDEPTCTGGVGVSASGGLGDAWTMNTANPLPTPTDTNPSAALGDLPSSNLDLTSATSAQVGGCYGATNILASTSTSAFGTKTASMTLPSSWVNGGDCAYGSLGSNSAGGNTDTQNLMNNGSSPATGNANCPPTQADVNAGLVDCTVVLSSGNDENGSTNYTSLDIFYNGQPVPQTPTAALSGSTVVPGGTVTVTGGTNWWGANEGAPNSAPYGDFQNSSADFYPVAAPSIYIGTSRATAVPVTNSTVTIGADSYACTGAESTTVGPNPCTLTVGKPTGTFQVPASLPIGNYNIYIDESNTTPLPGNGPNDGYQTALGTSLGTAESSTALTVAPIVVKTSTTAYVDGGYSAAGDTINYTYAVTNPSQDTVTNVTVSDNKIPTADINCPSTSLAANSSETCTATYTVTQADVDAGSVTNTATVSATDSVTSQVATSAPSSVTVLASDATSSLSLVKSTTSTGYGAAGDVIDYSYLVTNTGTTTESSVSVGDDLVADVSCPDPSLAPGASETCTGSYTVTQADVDNGSVTNTATASGKNPLGTTITSASSMVTVEASNAVTSVSLAKSVDPSTPAYGAAGNVVDYDYLVTNTGTTTLSSIAVNDNLIANVSCPDPTLAPGASETCTGSYTVTQADVDNGSVTNTATASATGPYANPVSSTQSSATVDASNATSSLSLTKSTNSTGYGSAGQIIEYSYLVTNTGTTTLSNIGVNDNLVSDVACGESSLAPAASETCTASYTVTQADVDGGSVTNTATATGTAPPSGSTVSSNSSSVTVEANGASSTLSITKSTNSTGYGAAGDVIDYSYKVDNTGTTDISDVGVSDNLIPNVSCPDTTLAPGASETCTGSYTVTQADVDNGSVTNTASAIGDDPADATITSNSSSITVDASGATSSLSFAKSTNASGYGAAGNVIDYSYSVTNTGTTTESNVNVSDNLIPNVSCPDSTLAPGASETCTGSYTVTQADVDGGSVSNTATANATNPSGHTITSGSSTVTVDANEAVSSLGLVKSSNPSAYGKAGDVIDYSYSVTNTGTTTESNVNVSDNLIPNVSCPDSTLAPGASETCTGSYTVTQADVDNGSVTNTASASAVNPQADSISSSQQSLTVQASNATATLAITKHSTAGGYTKAGQVLGYSYKVTNTGTTTLSAIRVADSKVSDVSCGVPTLAPGASETCTGSYTTTQADVEAKSLTNSATANGTRPPNGTAVISPSTEVTIEYSGVVINTKKLPTMTLSTPYRATLAASGGSAPYTWTALSALPSGFTLSKAGVLSGVVSARYQAPGKLKLEFQVNDSAGGMYTRTVKWKVVS